jgi:hypothetical protein
LPSYVLMATTPESSCDVVGILLGTADLNT